MKISFYNTKKINYNLKYDEYKIQLILSQFMVYGENGVTGPLALRHVPVAFKIEPAYVTNRFLSMEEIIVLAT